MQVITSLKENTPHKLSGAGAYEWWYFDGIDEKNEYSFVIIFFVGNPFSAEYNKKVQSYISDPGSERPDPKNYCCLSFSLYLRNREVYKTLYEFPQKEIKHKSPEGIDKIFIDKSSFYFNSSDNKYYLNIFLFPQIESRKFKAEFVFSPRTAPELLKSSDSPHDVNNHCWLPSSPLCDVTGKFKIYKDYTRRKTDLSGKGYHDHHWGNEAITGRIEKWYWGRIISNGYAVVFFNIEYAKKSAKPFKKVLLYKDDKLIYEKDDFEMNVKKSLNFTLLNYNNAVTLKFDDYTLVNRNDVKIENSAYHMRFLSRYDLYYKEDLIIDNVTGISEYLYPKRMNSGFFNRFAKKPVKVIEENDERT